MSENPWGEPGDESLPEVEVLPDHENLEAEQRNIKALEELEAKGRLNVFQRYELEKRREHALSSWVPPPEKGKGRQIRGTIDVNVGLFISRLIANKEGPWQDENSFVRAAISYFMSRIQFDEDKEYKGYFKLHWDVCRRAQLLRKLTDVAGAVKQIEGAVRAYLELQEIDEAAGYLRGEIARFTVAGSDYGRLALKKLEQTFTTGGPGMLAVWRRAA